MNTAPATRQPRKWEVDVWTTVQFVPTVGWINHFTAHDGSKVLSPCPGVLVQELRTTIDHWEVPRSDGTFETRSATEHLNAPYATRAVAAELEFGDIIPVDDVTGYRNTTTPDDNWIAQATDHVTRTTS